MTTPTNYIATWFYKESKEDASFYPQAGKRGDSALVHSIYMQIQVPFFTTFRHYHPDDKLLFFSNLDQFPDYLERLFKELRIETVTLLVSFVRTISFGLTRFLWQRFFHGESNFVSFGINGKDFHLDNVAYFHMVVDVLYKGVCYL